MVPMMSKSTARSFTLLFLACPECGGFGGFIREKVKVPCPTCFAARNWLELKFGFRPAERKA